MFRLRAPDRAEVERSLEPLADAPFSYADVGATRDGVIPHGFRSLRRRTTVGRGDDAFRAVRAALAEFAVLDLGWAWPVAPDPLEAGARLAVVVRVFGTYWVNPSRIVYVLDELAPRRRFGFAYGTLEGHAERGEERFQVERTPDDDVVYEVFSFSKPAHPLAKLGGPWTRRLQRRFLADSTKVARRAASAASRRTGALD